VAQLAGDGRPHREVLLYRIAHEHAAMVAAKKSSGKRDLQCEAVGRDLVRRIQHRSEEDSFREEREEAEHRGLPVVGAESAEETRFGDHAVPALADERGADERGWQRWEADEAVGDEIVALQWGRQRRRFGRLALAPVGVLDRERKSLRVKWSL
jgi:hypothetical protein